MLVFFFGVGGEEGDWDRIPLIAVYGTFGIGELIRDRMPGTRTSKARRWILPRIIFGA